ncbi:MAG: hypothetical protein JWL59_1604 [Chthoniobacteraceae bacterium]|nr:hypothetical protein [Chthoniobacteraceae bacterium]
MIFRYFKFCIYIVFFFIVFVISLASCGRNPQNTVVVNTWVDNVVLKWSVDKSGLAMALMPMKSFYRGDEPIELLIALQNRSGKSIDFIAPAEITGEFGLFVLHADAPDGSTCFDSSVHHPGTGALTADQLAIGETRLFRFSLTSPLWHTEVLGDYKLSLIYNDQGIVDQRAKVYINTPSMTVRREEKK